MTRKVAWFLMAMGRLRVGIGPGNVRASGRNGGGQRPTDWVGFAAALGLGLAAAGGGLEAGPSNGGGLREHGAQSGSGGSD